MAGRRSSRLNVLLLTTTCTLPQMLFPQNFISKKQSEKRKISQSSTMKHPPPPRGKEQKGKADKDRRPDDLYTTAHIFLVLQYQRITRQIRQIKTNNKIWVFF